MPRHNRSIEGLIVGPRKIRGLNTPFSTWKMSSRSPTSAMRISESSNNPPSQSGVKGNQGSVSVRKLACTLWETTDFSSPRIKKGSKEKTIRKIRRGRDRIGIHSGSLPPHVSNPSHNPLSKVEIRSQGLTPKGSIVGVKTRLKELNNGLITSKDMLKILGQVWGLDDKFSLGMSLVSALQVKLEKARAKVNQLIQEQRSDHKKYSSGMSLVSALQVELEKAHMQVNQMIQEQRSNHNKYSSGMPLVSALQVKLERTRVQVNQLIQELRSDHNEVNYYKKRFVEEKATWKSMKQGRIQAALKLISGDFEIQRKLRKQTESLNQILGMELAETKAALSKVIKKLESEKRAREMMQQVCDELARSIGEDREKMEELKRESAKVQEEVEKEREMLQLADVLREERVQMKLSEAKYQFEEKNAAVDNLRNELESFMRRAGKNQVGSWNHRSLSKTGVSDQNEVRGENGGEIEDGEECEEDSAESDLHSIELNMDNRNYMQSYATVAALEVLKRVSFEEEINERKSTCENIPRQISDGIEWDFSTENFLNWGDGYDCGRFNEIDKQG